MIDVLPPEAGLSINGMIYQYTLEKQREAEAQVTIQNENALGEGYILQQTDVWDNLPGSTISRILGFENIPREYWGDGSITVNGEAAISNPTVTYNYKFDPCFIILADPSCPGYEDALYQWLLDNDLLNKEPDPNDPFYDEWVQLTLNRETELEEESEDEQVEQDDEEDDETEVALFAADKAIKLANGAAQQAMLESLTNTQNIEQYYVLELEGGVYNETVQLQDKTLPDNRRALRNLATQQLHRDLVRSQYDRTQQTTEN